MTAEKQYYQRRRIEKRSKKKKEKHHFSLIVCKYFTWTFLFSSVALIISGHLLVKFVAAKVLIIPFAVFRIICLNLWFLEKKLECYSCWRDAKIKCAQNFFLIIALPMIRTNEFSWEEGWGGGGGWYMWTYIWVHSYISVCICILLFESHINTNW